MSLLWYCVEMGEKMFWLNLFSIPDVISNNYANLYMGQFEEAFLFKTDTHPLLSKILLCKRYRWCLCALGRKSAGTKWIPNSTKRELWIHPIHHADWREKNKLSGLIDHQRVMHYTQTYTQSPQIAIPCYMGVKVKRKRMFYHTASHAGLNQSVAIRQILTAKLKKKDQFKMRLQGLNSWCCHD